MRLGLCATVILHEREASGFRLQHNFPVFIFTDSLLASYSFFTSLGYLQKQTTITRVDRRRQDQVGKDSSQDKGEGMKDKAKGKAKEATGAVSGDEEKKTEGRADQTKGSAKEKVGEVKDKLT